MKIGDKVYKNGDNSEYIVSDIFHDRKKVVLKKGLGFNSNLIESDISSITPCVEVLRDCDITPNTIVLER